MQKRVLEKNKYLIYNKDRKILVFTSVSQNGFRYITVPGLILKGYNIDSTGKFSKLIRAKLIKEENLCYLKSATCETETYITENGKLKKQMLKQIRNYYSYYKEFSKEDYIFITKLCYLYNVLPEFLSIEEINKYIDIKLKIKTCYDIDVSMKESIEELAKKLKFIKY